MRDTRLIPIPGAIDGRRWKVTDTGTEGEAKTNVRSRTMRVPFGTGERVRQLQLHEMGHVAWSDNDPARVAARLKIPIALVEGAEDARITAALGAIGLPQDEPLLSEDVIYGRAMSRMLASPTGAVAMLAASYGTGDAEAIRGALRMGSLYRGAPPIDVAKVDNAIAEVLASGDPRSGELAERLALRLAEIVREATEREPEEVPGEGEGEGEGGDSDGLDDLFEGIPVPGRASGSPVPGKLPPAPSTVGELRRVEADDPGAGVGGGAPPAPAPKRAPSDLPPPPREATEDEVRDSLRCVRDASHGVEHRRLAVPRRRVKLDPRGRFVGWEEFDEGEFRWGAFNPETDTLRPRLTVRQGRAFLPRAKRRGTDAGSVPTGMHRLAIDGRVFRGPRMREGNAGAVLIDVSGSMALSIEDIMTVLDVMPAGIVACYSGAPNHLAILARRGLMVDRATLAATRKRMGGCNAIDGPALRWLAGQRGPRYWICDGHITGDHDSGVSPTMAAEVVQTCLRARIVRVDGVRQVVERFGRKAGGA